MSSAESLSFLCVYLFCFFLLPGSKAKDDFDVIYIVTSVD